MPRRDPIGKSHYFLLLVERETKALEVKGARTKGDQIWDYPALQTLAHDRDSNQDKALNVQDKYLRLTKSLLCHEGIATDRSTLSLGRRQLCTSKASLQGRLHTGEQPEWQRT